MSSTPDPSTKPAPSGWRWLAIVLSLAAAALIGLALSHRHDPATADPPSDLPPPPAVDAPPEAEPQEAPGSLPELAPPDAERLAEFAAHRTKTILELQLYRQSVSIPILDADGAAAEATLIRLNPRIDAWLVLQLALPASGGTPSDDRGLRHEIYHLENPDPGGVEVALDAGFPHGVVLRAADGETRCDLWSATASPSVTEARASGRVFAELCGGRLYLRNRTEGRKTRLEMATDLLRDSVWGGERITTFVRQNLYRDRFLETSEVTAPDDPSARERPRPTGAPRPPLVDPRFDGQYLQPAELGLELDDETPDKVLVGRWYAVRGQPGVFVSTIQPQLVAPEVKAGLKGKLNPLDEVESAALAYLVAFDLAAFDVGFALGTDHPRVAWSERALPTVRDDALPGPDGIGTVAPLVRTGRISPAAARRVAATFTGGFKRSHGAFKHTALATTSSGSHYGFVESGTVLSKLVPGLATAIVWDDGEVELKTWSSDDDASLGRVRHARQNGVPLIEVGEDGTSRPGALVRRWAEGNWSGSQEKRLRTLRAGLCLQAPPTSIAEGMSEQEPESRFLVYAYFSGATPSAMVQVLTAYDCRYAMLLDMNALEHTYLALYSRQGARLLTQHLIAGMSVLDETVGDQELPRFVAFSDNRDFFYLLRRQGR